MSSTSFKHNYELVNWEIDSEILGSKVVSGYKSSAPASCNINHGFIGTDCNINQLLDIAKPDNHVSISLRSNKDEQFTKIQLPKQTHSTEIINFQTLINPNIECDGDAVLLKKGEAAGIKTADCVPLIIVSANNNFGVIVHAGWRGAVRGIVQNAVNSLTKASGSASSTLTAVIGPAAGDCCYQVGEEVTKELNNIESLYFKKILLKENNHFSVPKYVLNTLISEGILAENINLLDICSICGRNSGDLSYFSYRREGQKAGRNLSFLKL